MLGCGALFIFQLSGGTDEQMMIRAAFNASVTSSPVTSSTDKCAGTLTSELSGRLVPQPSKGRVTLVTAINIHLKTRFTPV